MLVVYSIIYRVFLHRRWWLAGFFPINSLKGIFTNYPRNLTNGGVLKNAWGFQVSESPGFQGLIFFSGAHVGFLRRPDFFVGRRGLGGVPLEFP